MRNSTTSRPYFEGWYLKQQNKTQSLALIASVHTVASRRPYGFLQVITQDSSHAIPLPIQDARRDRTHFYMQLGNCHFSQNGCSLDLDTPELLLTGKLEYSQHLTPRYDIMGPFSCLPFMECSHSVISYHHKVNGSVFLQGEEYRFENQLGYLEGDRGNSFPQRYLWTQCSFSKGCIMLSVADIPMLGFQFMGCIGAIVYQGKEHRIATYLGASVLYGDSHRILVRQGDLLLDVTLLQENPLPLSAPCQGDMTLPVHESVKSTVRYRAFYRGKKFLSVTHPQASFESHWDTPFSK